MARGRGGEKKLIGPYKEAPLTARMSHCRVRLTKRGVPFQFKGLKGLSRAQYNEEDVCGQMSSRPTHTRAWTWRRAYLSRVFYLHANVKMTIAPPGAARRGAARSCAGKKSGGTEEK